MSKRRQGKRARLLFARPHCIRKRIFVTEQDTSQKGLLSKKDILEAKKTRPLVKKCAGVVLFLCYPDTDMFYVFDFI
jgi:hypothetical protein